MQWWAGSSLNSLLRLQRHVAKRGSELFCYWPLLRSNKMATNLWRCIGVLPHVTIERRLPGRQCCETAVNVCFVYQCLHKFVKLVTKESARFDNNDNETKSQIRLLKFPEGNNNFAKTPIVKSVLSFFQCQNENECFSRRGNCRPQSGRILK